MNTNKFGKVLAALAASSALLFAGCGGGGGGGGSTTTLSGTAAVGAPIAGATVTLTGADGDMVTATTGADGTFSADVAALTLPIALFVENGTDDQFSISFTQNGTVNITPLTTMALSMAFNSADLVGLLAAWETAAGNINPDELLAAMKVINANLATAYGDATVALDEITYDFFTTAFAANGTGFDALLDAINAVDCTITDGVPIVYACNGGTLFTGTFTLTINTSGFFPFGSIDFAIVPDSTWSFTLGGSVNGVAIPAITEPDYSYFFVPTTLGGAYYEYGSSTFTDPGTGQTTTISLTSASLDSTGNGDIGSTVTVRLAYTIVTSGGTLPAPVTVSYVLVQTYTRTAPAII